MYKKDARTILLWVSNVGQVGDPEVENQNYPTTVDFFFIMLKVDLKISPLLERPFCEKFSIFISI